MEAAAAKNNKLEKIVDAIANSDLSSVKTVVGRLIKTLNNPKSTARDLKKIIGTDPTLSAKVLRVANSSFYAPETPVTDIGKAIVWIGYDMVRELALRQKACKLFENNEEIAGYRRSELWIYSAATAFFSRMIYTQLIGKHDELIYSAALLHKIGLIVEEQFLRKAFTTILHIMNRKGEQLISIEERLLGFTHIELGTSIAKRWRLPEEIVMIIAHQSYPFQAPESCFEMAAVLYVASIQCHFLHIGYYQSTLYDDALYVRTLESLGIEQDILDKRIKAGYDDFKQMLHNGAL